MKKLIPSLCMLISIQASAAIDTLIGKSVPVMRDYKVLTARVCEGASTEELKANAIYNWVTTHIAFDIPASKNPDRPDETVKDILQKEKTTSDGYTLLFTTMCREAGLHAVTIEGYTKSWIFDNGDPFYIPRHSWCAVMIDGNWQIVDPTRGAGMITGYTGWLKKQLKKLSKPKLEYDDKERFEFEYNPKYFMHSPLSFRMHSIPADPLWQLAPEAMPLQVFETSDSAITAYNNAHYTLQQNNASLLHIAGLDEREKILDAADRMYAYNNRMVLAKGLKKYILALKKMEQPRNNKAGITIAKQELKEALVYYKEQKQAFPEYYITLNKKNDTKNRETLEHLRQIKTSDKIYMAKCKRYESTCGRKNEDIAEKYKKALEPIKLLTRTENTKIQKSPASPEMKKHKEAVAERSGDIEALAAKIQRLEDSIVIAIQHHNYTKEQLAGYLGESQQKLLQEAGQRIVLHDHYDDEIRPYIEPYKQLRFQQADTLMNHCFAEFDEINKQYDALRKNYIELLDLHKDNLKDIATYKAWCNVEDDFTAMQQPMLGQYRTVNSSYIETLKQHTAYYTSNGSFFKELQKLYDNENELIADMETAERTRHEKEDKTLKESKTFDEGDNRRQQRQIENHISKLDNLLRK